MRIEDFEKELKQIDENLAIRPNPPHKVFPELEKIASVTYKGADLFAIPNFNIYDEHNPNYGVDVRDEGKITPHRNRIDALQMAQVAVERLNSSKDYRDLILGVGAYSDAELRKPTSGTELVEEVEMDLKEVTGKSDHAHTLPK